ncbi:hypothetical protein ACKFKF_30805 [Phormidesmis sp. 146-12]
MGWRKLQACLEPFSNTNCLCVSLCRVVSINPKTACVYGVSADTSDTTRHDTLDTCLDTRTDTTRHRNRHTLQTAHQIISQALNNERIRADSMVY